MWQLGRPGGKKERAEVWEELEGAPAAGGHRTVIVLCSAPGPAPEADLRVSVEPP